MTAAIDAFLLVTGVGLALNVVFLVLVGIAYLWDKYVD